MASEATVRRSLALCAKPECLDRVHDLLDDLWSDAPGVEPGDRIGFETAVVEVLANIVEHAGDGTTRVDLNLELQAYRDRFEALFSDTGREARVDLAAACLPRDLDEEGRGLALARAAADEVAYEREGSLNRWRVVRRRTG
jgi:anti-sigma regulatory factor (Ser/Thr protein kinase)